MDALTYRDLRIGQRLDDEEWQAVTKISMRRIVMAENAAEFLSERERRVALMTARAAKELPLFEE